MGQREKARQLIDQNGDFIGRDPAWYTRGNHGAWYLGRFVNAPEIELDAG